jgi:DNA-binding transcriptional ArsR family regulator
MQKAVNQVNTELVWKALADPTRRKLLDLVRSAPRTTGDLADAFEDIGRCAVMKHLDLLETCGLLVTRKEGRFKWNHINAVPLQAIYERWVKKYEAQWASSLLQLKELAEYSSNIDHQINTLMDRKIESVNTMLEVPMRADIRHVWKCLITDVNLWWRKDFYTSPKTKAFIIEPRVGGRMYEDYGHDEGLLWANVIVLDAPYLLELKGHLTPQFGGPAVSFLRLSLAENNGLTTLTLSDTVLGAVTGKTQSDLKEGWELLFAESFANYVGQTKP